MIELSKEGDVHVVTMTAEPTTVQPDFLSAMHGALDEIDGACASGPGAIVLTGTGKTFNAGLDVPVVTSLKGEDAKRFSAEIMRLMHRLLVGPMPVVAALNGHAFAAGAFLALACDSRVMRADRGWFCVPEVDVGVPIGGPMMGILRAKVPPHVASEAALTGRRYTGEEALAAHFVDELAGESELVSASVERAAVLGAKGRDIFGKIKRTLWRDVAGPLAPES